jgi:hypothetical protein
LIINAKVQERWVVLHIPKFGDVVVFPLDMYHLPQKTPLLQIAGYVTLLRKVNGFNVKINK